MLKKKEGFISYTIIQKIINYIKILVNKKIIFESYNKILNKKNYDG